MAGGLTVEASLIPELTAFLDAYLKEEVAEARKNLSFNVDAQLSPTAATPNLIKTIERVGPYGADHPQPMFVFANMHIAYAERVRGGHVRCSFADDSGQRISGICFRADETGLSDVLLAPNPGRVHVAGKLKQDEWKGRIRIDLNVEDLAFST